jgi:cell division protein FtsI/penicillin-binding protein 2
MDPFTGKIIAMANSPIFDNNSYANVYDKEPIYLDPAQEQQVVIEVYNPENNVRVLKAYIVDLTPEGRQLLTKETQARLDELDRLYGLKAITRYYYYIGENTRREIFPTTQKGIWLKYKNNIGVGSYVNRTVQEVYEPGSVMKSVTMAIAIDQGEVSPLDIYNDTGAVKVDVYTIKNALNKYYGKVTLVDCIAFSINTCMTSVSRKLGRKLFQAELESFGFGKPTGIELDNELPGDLKPWREWSPALVMTMAFGQGISATPLQMITAYTALANGGRLVKPTIIDEIRKPDGTVDKKQPMISGQVIKPETASTITAMLVHSAEFGFAKAGKVKGHRIAGKTGTSQIAGPGGKYEAGTGSTVATYAGYAPVEHPRFVILVKLDRPKKDDFGSKSAAPLFKDIAQFLFDYYGIPPDEK